MAIHFLQSKAARTLSLAQVFRMTEEEVETAFRKIRWGVTEGKPVCPECGGLDPYEYRRPTGLLRFRCKACGKNYSLTSGTLFASHKAPLRAYLAAIAVFMNEVKGKSALALSRDLGILTRRAGSCCTRSAKRWPKSSRAASWVVLAEWPRSMAAISAAM